MKNEAHTSFLIYLLHFIVQLSTTTQINITDLSVVREAPLEEAIIQFDPYVSILDSGNFFRYNTSDLIPLLSKVTSSFKRILVQLSEVELQSNVSTSLELSPLTAAQYNKMSNRTKETIDVWLTYGSGIPECNFDPDEYIFHEEPMIVVNRLISLANKANALFSDTVSTIIVPYRLILNDMDLIRQSVGTNLSATVRKWGLLVDSDTFRSFPNFQSHLSKLRPNIVLLRLRPLPYYSDYYSCFRSGQNLIRQLPSDMEHGWIVNIPDTYPNGRVNLTGQIQAWNLSVNWAMTHGITNVISKAFDTPYADAIERKTTGWWRLIENASYNSTADFMFEEKVKICNLVDEMENSETLKPHSFNFSNGHVGIIFSLYNKTRIVQRQVLSPDESRLLVQKVTENFSSVVILVHDDSRDGYRAWREELAALGKIDTRKIDVTMLFLPKVSLKKMIKGEKNQYNTDKNVYRDLVKPVTSYIFPFRGNDTAEVEEIMKRRLSRGIGVEKNEYKSGYSFNISICSSYAALADEEKNIVMDYLTKEAADTIIFYFEECAETVKLGSQRMFRQRIVVLDQCQKLLASGRNLKSVKLKFMMLHYSSSSRFYRSKRDILNFVEYWKLLSDWAVNSDTTIVFSNALDGDRYFKDKAQLRTELGWWRFENGTDENKSVLTDKLEDFEFKPDSKIAEPTTGLKLHEIVMIILIPLLFTTVCVVHVFFIIRVKYMEKLLSQSEIKAFFNGDEKNQDESAHSIPYDKSRYEINTKDFTIDTSCALGSGEFGTVNRATFQRNNKEFDAAVKTSNTKRPHKTALTGLLSEIKILSFVGKHDNIVELLGANTGGLVDGNIFVFLELCELGSLETYLRGTRPHSNGRCGRSYENVDVLPELHSGGYLVIPSLTVSLDDELYQDMYRWSREICSAMKYLASKNVVHADLATRNVLLNSSKVAKICDFGLSRRMYNYATYAKEQQEPLPWKWMSPESLRFLEFNEKSDVWAFGVTIWEIYSLGDSPYLGKALDCHFASDLEDGLRLEEPEFNNRNMYEIMQKCWQLIPNYRPTFSELLALFE